MCGGRLTFFFLLLFLYLLAFFFWLDFIFLFDNQLLILFFGRNLFFLLFSPDSFDVFLSFGFRSIHLLFNSLSNFRLLNFTFLRFSFLFSDWLSRHGLLFCFFGFFHLSLNSLNRLHMFLWSSSLFDWLLWFSDWLWLPLIDFYIFCNILLDLLSNFVFFPWSFYFDFLSFFLIFNILCYFFILG